MSANKMSLYSFTCPHVTANIISSLIFLRLSILCLFHLSFLSLCLFQWLSSVMANPLSLSELALSDVPAHVELHVLQAAQCVREEHGGGHSTGFKLQIRLSSGEHYERVLPTPQLQPHTDRRPVGHQGLRHRHASGWVGRKWKCQRNKEKGFRWDVKVYEKPKSDFNLVI